MCLPINVNEGILNDAVAHVDLCGEANLPRLAIELDAS